MKKSRLEALTAALSALALKAGLIIAWLATGPPLHAASPAETASLRRQIGAGKGLCVLAGEPDPLLAAQWARQSELIFYLQIPDAAQADAARRRLEKEGLYGTRIYVEQGPQDRLYLADNLADAVVVSGPPGLLPEAEALRVACPGGRIIQDGKFRVKPFPAGADDWSHPYHGPDNNPVSRDTLARGPYLTQFLADPRYAPLPQVAVAAGGRIFKAFGHIAFKEREEPWLNTLAAFNGYNGTLLWRREIAPALMVHRSTLIATADRVYFGDDYSCKVLSAATGELVEEIAPPAAEAGGTFWKWMALEGETLYALIGDQEKRDPVITAKSTRHGWPWNPLSPGFNTQENPWGYGRVLQAINVKTKKVLWRYEEQEPLDSRALCLKNGRLYAYRHGHYLTCLEAETGSQVWRRTPENAPELFAALGPRLQRQDWRTNWRTTALLRAGDQALYFAGPDFSRLVAVSTSAGQVLWSQPYDNYQLILRADGLYGISGQIDKEVSRRFDPLTGRVLAELAINRRACTRPTASSDAIFFRAGEGSVRLDIATGRPQLVSPMRPNCHDGVTVANGLLYWWPSVCDCNLTLYGITCLGPAGDFNFAQPAREAERLETFSAARVDAEPAGENDWPVFRANNLGAPQSQAVVREQAERLWECAPKSPVTPSAPTAVGSLVYFSGSDGVVRAIEAATGQPAWMAFTGGEVRLPPTIDRGVALAGSGDGWVYAWQARDGRPLWRFRAAPIERRIPVYGALLSTWPAASGVVAQDGVAYAAAGLANYDGTHVYALDAATGRLRWQNNTSGHLDAESRAGVGVQGHLLIHQGQLFMAGGNAVSPARYDLATGVCRNEAEFIHQQKQGQLIGSFSPRGWELYLVGGEIRVAGKPYYAHPQYGVFDNQVLNKTLYLTAGGRDLAWVNNARLLAFADLGERRAEFQRAHWGKLGSQNPAPLWDLPCKESRALAVGVNAAVIATVSEIMAVRLADGVPLWKHPLPAPPVPWGLALTRHGRVVVALEGGRLVCYQ